MELEQLHRLEAIDRYGTMSAAAEHLHISQPSLSRSVRRLESDLGQQLFDRTGQQRHLQRGGQAGPGTCARCLPRSGACVTPSTSSPRRQRTIKVLSVAPVPTWRLTTLAVKRFPGTILDTELVDERQVESALVNQETDLGITLRPL